MSATSAFTISIPTFNRCDILFNTLTNVCSLAEAHRAQTGENIEVICLDNASTDDTPSVVTGCQERFPFLRYIRNEHNIGLIQNIRKAIVSARSDYVWTLGDDDYPTPWCMSLISRTLAYLKVSKIEHAFQLYAMAYCDPDFRFGGQPQKSQHLRILSPGCSVLAEESIHGIALISRWIFVRRYWDDAFFDSIYRDTDIYTFIHVMLRSALKVPVVMVPASISIASDRGSRKYYHYRTGIARALEFPEIENLVLNTHGFRKGSKMLTAERKVWLRDRVPFIVKLNLLQSDYPQVQHVLSRPISGFWAERMILVLIHHLAKIPLVNRFLLRMYHDHRKRIAE